MFVAGATGRLGARIVKMLLEKNNQIKVRPNIPSFLGPGSPSFLWKSHAYRNRDSQALEVGSKSHQIMFWDVGAASKTAGLAFNSTSRKKILLVHP